MMALLACRRGSPSASRPRPAPHSGRELSSRRPTVRVERPGRTGLPRKERAPMKIALLGTGFGRAHAAVYATRTDVDEVIVFGRTPEKLATIAVQFGFATTTELAAALADDSVDLVDVCLPTRLDRQSTRLNSSHANIS